MPTERTEAILQGMVQAFEFFGRIPREVWWDNPKTVAAQILTGRDRKANPRYAALASHYVFEPLFCMPASGNEKPVVENRVKTMQRRWGTPVPRVKDLAELNEYLRACCHQDQSRRSSDSKSTIGERLRNDLLNSASLPKHRFDACVRCPATVDKYQFARFDNVHYSVPRAAAFKAVMVKGYVDRVDIVRDDRIVATHERSYESGDQILDPLHYLVTLSRRPAALDHSNVYREWKLPHVFGELRTRLEDRHGSRSGVRQFVRVLQLLGEHSMADVARAIEQLRGPEGADADRIIRRVQQSAARRHGSQSESLDGLVRDAVTDVSVPSPGLAHFDSFLTSTTLSSSQGHTHDKTQRHDAAENESQTTPTADDRSGVRQTGPGSLGIESDIPAVSAAADGVGNRHPSGQCPSIANPSGELSRGEGSGGLRLLGIGGDEQTESSRIGEMRMDCRTVECLSAGSTGHWQNALGDCVGELGGLPWI